MARSCIPSFMDFESWPSLSDAKNRLPRYDSGVATVAAITDKFSLVRSCEPQQQSHVSGGGDLRPSLPCDDAGVSTVSNVRSCEPQPRRRYYTSEEYTSEDENDKDKDDSVRQSMPTEAYKDFLQFPLYTYTFQDDVLSFTNGINFSDSEVLTEVNQWFATLDESDGQSFTWIHVHAYYSKKKGHGGYGVILRNALAKPIIASAKFSKDGVSLCYQMFKGMNAGVKHAEDHNLSNLHVRCGSIRVPGLFYSLSNCPCKTSDSICKNCVACLAVRHCKTAATPIAELRLKKLTSLMYSPLITPARYVAKMEKMKVLEVEKKEKSSATSNGSVFSPGVFPPGLKYGIYADSFALNLDVKRMANLLS